MRIINNGRHTLFTAFLVVAAWSHAQPLAQAQPVSILIIRHAETDQSQPTLPLSAAGRQRAELLAQTLRGVKFTHIFASHTTRARQMVEGIASAHGLSVVQLPVPGSIVDGQPVTDQTSRRAPIEPISAALLKLTPWERRPCGAKQRKYLCNPESARRASGTKRPILCARQYVRTLL